MKRGRYNRPFLHFITMSMLGLGVALTPLLADTYPIFSSQATIKRLPSEITQERSLSSDNNVFQTNESAKPRDSIVIYTVQRGDTLETIAQKFSQPNNPISVDTIKMENDLTDDDLNIGEQLRILPVTGVAYKVQPGDTVYTIAQKFHSNPQAIVDWPFNNFANPETFTLIAGEILIVPGGVKSTVRQIIPQQPSYIAQAPSHITFTGGGFHWPIQGEITQGFTSYHPGIDIAGPAGTPIYASKAGVVLEASCGWNYGYGCHVLISHGDGWSTMYAHMVTTPSVSVGQSVSGGQLIGYRGTTGRSTGNHTHFEIRSPNGNVNPLAYLQ